jgi:antiphage defense system Thoeris ThsB-like protein
MARRRVFISFDYDNDKEYKYLLEAWNANPRFEFVFSDATPDEINTYNVGRIKAALTAKINTATHTFVIVGREANKTHRNQYLIGFRNWINFEIHQSKLNGNRLAAVKLNSSYELPEELNGTMVSWAWGGFKVDSIINALDLA